MGSKSARQAADAHPLAHFRGDLHRTAHGIIHVPVERAVPRVHATKRMEVRAECRAGALRRRCHGPHGGHPQTPPAPTRIHCSGQWRGPDDYPNSAAVHQRGGSSCLRQIAST